jgi:hypothetical protein
LTKSNVRGLNDRVDRLKSTSKGAKRNEALPVDLELFNSACERCNTRMTEFERKTVEVTLPALYQAERNVTSQNSPLPAEVLVKSLQQIHENAVLVAARAVHAVTRLEYGNHTHPDWLTGLRVALARTDPCALGILYANMTFFPQDKAMS